VGIFLANPWGLLALVAIPAIVGVHFLQERSRRVRASTLFLLERAQPTAAAGARIERFRQSLPFWMQVLAAAVAAWLLADPRIVRRDSRQTVAVVLDSSASMQACREQTLARLAARLPAWNAAAGRTDWHLLETGPRRPPLYAGAGLSELLEAARTRWRPTLGTHDTAAAIMTAASLAPPGTGAVILVTDRPQRVPEGVGLLSAGGAFDNVGFSGGDIRIVDGQPRWRALVTNHGASAESRTVAATVSGTGGSDVTIGPPEEVTLAPGHSHTLEGPWPDVTGRLTLRLSADRFTTDDVLPLVRPVPQLVRIAQVIEGPTADLIVRMALAAGNVERVDAPDEADLVIGDVAADPDRDAILFPVGTDDAAAETEPPQPATFDAAWLSPEHHPLVDDLAWGGLLSGPAGGLSARPADEPLLWKGQRPFVILRRATLPGGRPIESLVLDFDVSRSTAARTPAFVVLIARFVDRVRMRTGRAWAANVDASQPLDVPADDDGRATLVTDPVRADVASTGASTRVDFQGRAPDEPAFFAVVRADAAGPLVSGAAQFADARESDFRDAAPADTLETLRREAALKQSVEDPWMPLWLGGLAAALAVAWAAGGATTRG